MFLSDKGFVAFLGKEEEKFREFLRERGIVANEKLESNMGGVHFIIPSSKFHAGLIYEVREEFGIHMLV